MGQHVKVQQLPGVGVRYDVAARRVPKRVSVIVHKDGGRELYVFDGGGSEPTAVLEFDESQARLLGAVLSGAYVED